MTLDAQITQAINDAVDEADQPEALARRLTAWFEAITSGNEDINDDETTIRHLEVLFEWAVVQGNDGENKY